jgi:hypothetical protein
MVYEAELEALKLMAEKEQTSVANLIRKGLNSLALDSGDDACIMEVEPTERWHKFEPITKAKAISMQVGGYSYRTIARQLGCSTSMVAKWIREAKCKS